MIVSARSASYSRNGEVIQPCAAPLARKGRAGRASRIAKAGEPLVGNFAIGPNHVLAKIAGKLEKPNGFQWLSTENMPGRIAHLALDDLPGISSAMRSRLELAGIKDVTALCALDPRHARAIWRSIEGEKFVRSLQGEAIPLTRTRRGGFGNSKILAPEFRDPRSAYLVSRWLIEKAATRLRRDGRTAASFAIHISCENAPGLARTVSCAASQDTAIFLRINRALWRRAWPYIRGHRIVAVGVQLGHVEYLTNRNGDMLRHLPAAAMTRGERAAAAVDFINGRFGSGAITYGVNKPHPGFFERG